MRSMILILLSTTLISSSFAQNAVKLEKGQSAPFEGVLLTKERAEKAVKAEKKNIVLSDLRIAQDELIEFHKTDARRQRRKLSQAKFESHIYNAAYFIFGALAASYAFKIQQEVNR